MGWIIFFAFAAFFLLSGGLCGYALRNAQGYDTARFEQIEAAAHLNLRAQDTAQGEISQQKPVFDPTKDVSFRDSAKQGAIHRLFWNFDNAAIGNVARAPYPIGAKIDICTLDEKRRITVEVIHQTARDISVGRSLFAELFDPQAGSIDVIVFME